MATVVQLTDDLQLDRQMRHDIEVVIDRLVVEGRHPRAAGRSGRAGAEAGRREPDRRASRRGEREAAKPQRRAATRTTERREATTPTRRRRSGKRRSAAAARRHRLLGRTTPARTAACSFEPPSPQLFSFNSPQGMCLECDGLGEQSTASIRSCWSPTRSCRSSKGAIELVGPWQELGRWRRHIYQGVAETIERKLRARPTGTLLETPWAELDPKLQQALAVGHRRRAHHVHLARRQRRR